MRAALAVPRIVPDVEANLETIARLAEHAAEQGADLVQLPEAVTTGLSLCDSFVEDLLLGTAIPGPITDRLAELAYGLRGWLGAGLLERDGMRLYGSAVLFSQAGATALTYRRVDSHWHADRVEPDTYCEGECLDAVDTPLGRLAFALCGDLFSDDVTALVRRAAPDVLRHPMVRCFPDGSHDQTRWDTEELDHYAARAAVAGVPTLTVNYLADQEMNGGGFGGPWAFSAEGEVLAELPLGEEGVLMVEVG